MLQFVDMENQQLFANEQVEVVKYPLQFKTTTKLPYIMEVFT